VAKLPESYLNNEFMTITEAKQVSCKIVYAMLVKRNLKKKQ